MSGNESGSDYSFMRSGTTMDTSTDDTDLITAIQAMVLVFLEDATKMAVSYTQGKYPETTVISGETIVKCLKARAQFGIQLNDQYRERMETIIQRTGEYSDNDRLDTHFSLFFREVEEEREKNEAKGEVHQAAIDIIVQTVDRLEPQFNDWQPTDRFQSLLKDAIANVSREMD